MANAITLTSGMRKNLFSLQNTEKMLQSTQTRLATGLRVQKAVDDPINFFTAQEHRQRADDLSARKDEMAESIQLVNAANDGVESITSLSQLSVDPLHNRPEIKTNIGPVRARLLHCM